MDATRYSVVFPDTTLTFDRCEKHSKEFQKLRSADDAIRPTKGRKTFHVADPGELRAAVARGKNH